MKSKVEKSVIAAVERIYAGVGDEVMEIPYTQTFDDLYAKFRAETGMELTNHELWLAL
jgi:hypothetical protein